MALHSGTIHRLGGCWVGCFSEILPAVKILSIIFSICFVSISFAEQPDVSCAIARQAIIEASLIRKLAIKKAVPCEVDSKEQVKNFILDTLKTKIPADKLRLEAVVYKALGLIPEGFDYEKGMVDLYLSQLGGYYDPDKKHFVMAGWLPKMMQPSIAAHELTHALQDQYYNLNKIIDSKSENSDEQLARSSLIEGDATAVMMDFARRGSGETPIETLPDVNSFMMQNVVGLQFSSAMSGTPQSLQMLLIFPYTSGLRFVHSLLFRGSYGEIDKAFKRLPRSTEEILHPEKYLLQKEDFIQIEDRDTLRVAPSGSQIVYRDTLGEFAVSALLGTYLADKGRAAEAAAGWGGDKVSVLAGADKKPRQVIWVLNWDSEKDAAEFIAAFNEAMETRYAAANAIKAGRYKIDSEKLKVTISIPVEG